MERIRRPLLIILLSGLTVGLLFLGYLYWIEKGISADTIAARDTDISTLRGQSNELTEQLQASQAELDVKQAELEAKIAEIAKAAADLATKTKSLTDAQKKIKDQESQLSANNNELEVLRQQPPLFTFSVESGSLANADQKKEDIKALVTDAYSVITEIYSKPYLLHSVTIAFVDSISNPNAQAEIVISNGSSGLSLTIKLKDYDKNDFNDVSSVIHEIIHSFHGVAILDPVPYEEGITVAATDAVLARLIANGSIPAFSPLYVRISSVTYTGSELTVPSNASTFYNSASVADYYQLMGYGWLQIYNADTNFFKSFNERIYTHKRDGEEITEALVKQVLLETMPAVIQGQSREGWLTTKAFALN